MARKRIYRCSHIFMGWDRSHNVRASAYTNGDKMTVHSIKRVDYDVKGKPTRLETNEAIFVLVIDQQ